jgi:arabinofuranosyltransferase
MTDDRAAWVRAGRIACAVAIGAYVVVLLRTAWMSDDAYITLRTVDNFVHGFGLRWNVAERVQTFTHPMWLFLIAAFYFVTREAFYTVTVLSIAVSVAAVALLARSRRSDPWAALVMLLALLFSKAFIDYSTSGLENPLTHLLLVLLVILLPDEPPDDRRLFLLALIVGLGVLTRTDNILLFGPALVLAMARHRRRRGPAIVLAGLVPLLAWHAFSVVYYGIPYPNTALAKLNTGIPAGELADAGWNYLANSLRVDPLTLTLSAGGVVAAIVSRRGRAIALATGVVLDLFYVVRIGGDFMSGRFLSAPFFLSVALLGGIGWGSVRWRGPAAVSAIIALGFWAPHPTVLSGRGYGTRQTDAIDSGGVADERGYYFFGSGMLNGRSGWFRPVSKSWRAGSELRVGRVELTVEGAVGFLGYAAGPGVHIVDYHGLGDPLLARLPIVRRDPLYAAFRSAFQLGPSEHGWRPGHYLRSIPAGYLETLATGSNALVDPAIAGLYDEVARITRGPVVDAGRFGLILRRLAGGLPEVSRGPRTDFVPVPWDDLVAVQPDNPEARYQWGLARQGDDPQGALEQLQHAIRIQPGHGRALVSAAALLGNYGRLAEGLRLIDRAIAGDPGDFQAWNYRALLLAADGRRREAIEAALEAARIAPGLSADIYTFVGLEYAKLQELEQALTWLRRAEALDPRLARTSLLLGNVLGLQGRAGEATAAFERALELDPTLETAALDLASVHAGSGDPDAALRALERFSQSNPASAEVLFRQGELLAARGQRELAVEKWSSAAARGHSGAREALERTPSGP